MNILIAGDLHIDLQSLEECSLILNEQKELIKKYNVTTYISTGDNFNFIKPTSKELDLFASFLKEINIPSIIIAAQSHESETPEDSILNHFGILSNTITVVKEYYDGNKLFVGHFGLKESKLNKFGATHSVQEFKQFKWVVLGHFHSYERIGKNCVQLGSSRWVDFSEAQDKAKIVLLIENYDTEIPKCSFIALKSPYRMVDIILNSNKDNKLDEKDLKITPSKPLQDTILGQNQETGKDTIKSQSRQITPTNPLNLRQFNEICQLTTFLDKLPEKTKIRIIFKDYHNWVNFLPYYQKYKEKFILFRDKKEFIMSSNLVITKQENIPLKESLIKWMEQNKINEQIKNILLEEIK